MYPVQVSTPAAQPEPSHIKEVAAVAVGNRLSDFWCDKPSLWFSQTEAILAPQKLSDEAKFNMVIGRLNKDVLDQVSDILRDPPETGKFNAVKTRLIATYEDSDNQLFEKLLNLELGENKPTQLLRRMRHLARGKVEEETLAKLWMRQLPASVKGVLAVTGTKDLEGNARSADKIMEGMQSKEVLEVTTTPSASSDAGEQIAKLTAQFEKFQDTQKQGYVRGRGGFYRRGRSSWRSRGTQRTDTILRTVHTNVPARVRGRIKRRKTNPGAASGGCMHYIRIIPPKRD